MRVSACEACLALWGRGWGGPNLESILALTGTLDTEVGEGGGWGESGGDGDLMETP